MPPAGLLDRLRALERPARPGLRWTSEGQWHVTLKFFGGVDADALMAALDSWAGLPPGLPAATAVAGPGPEALARRVWVLPVQGLEELAGGVDAATLHLGGDAGAGAGGEGPGAGGGGGGEGVPGEAGSVVTGPGSAEGGDPASRPSRAPRPFRGHLTLARARHPSALSHLPRPLISMRWQVQEIMAVRSELRDDGAHHEVLRRWRLPPG